MLVKILTTQFNYGNWTQMLVDCINHDQTGANFLVQMTFVSMQTGYAMFV